MLSLHVRLVNTADGIPQHNQLSSELLRERDDAVVVGDATALQHNVTVGRPAQRGPLRLKPGQVSRSGRG